MKKKKAISVGLVLVMLLNLLIIFPEAINGYDNTGTSVRDGFVYHVSGLGVPSWFSSHNDGTKYLDVLNGFTANNSEVWLYDLNINAACQEWKFICIGTDTDGYKLYNIMDINSGKYLSIENDSFSAYARVVIREKDNGTGQVFKIKQRKGGIYFLSKCSNYTKAIYKEYRYTGGGIEYYRLYQYYYLSEDYRFLWYLEYASQNRYEQGVGVPDGHYIMHNVVDNNDTGDSVAYNSGNKACLVDFTTLDETADPLFRYEGKGYYSIVYSGKYLTANSSISSGKAVTWNSSFTSSNTQLWKIEERDDNYVTIRSKNLVDAGKKYYLQNKGGLFNSNNLVQNSGTGRGQWHLVCNELDIASENIMIGVVDSTHSNHSLWMESAANSLYNMGLNSNKMFYQIDYSHCSSDDYTIITDEIERGGPKIVTFRGHGYGNVSSSEMYLYDINGTGQYIHTIDNQDVRNCDFSSTEIILYIGCMTAKDYVNNSSTCHNLPKDSVDYAGCQIAVGFTTTITCVEANKFAARFYQCYSEYIKNLASNYNQMTVSEQLDTRIQAYISALGSAVNGLALKDYCVYYYNGAFQTLQD